MTNLPTTRRGPGATSVAPFVVVVVHTERDIAPDPLRAAITSWADSNTNVVSRWNEIAREVLFLTDDGSPYATPAEVYEGTYRWAALVREAGNEYHIYIGLRTVDSISPPSPVALTERATDLVTILTWTKGWDGRRSIRLGVSAELYLGGEQSGRAFKHPPSFLAIAKDPDTFKEGGALFIAALTGLFSAGTPLTSIPPTQWIVTGLGVLLGYLAFSFLRWVTVKAAKTWAVDEWTVKR